MRLGNELLADKERARKESNAQVAYLVVQKTTCAAPSLSVGVNCDTLRSAPKPSPRRRDAVHQPREHAMCDRSPCWKTALTSLLLFVSACTSDLPPQPGRTNPFDANSGWDTDVFQLSANQSHESISLSWVWPEGFTLDGARLYQSIDGVNWSVIQDLTPPMTSLDLPLTNERLGRELSFLLTGVHENQQSGLDSGGAVTLRTRPLMVVSATGNRFTNNPLPMLLLRRDGALQMKVSSGGDSSLVPWQSYATSALVQLASQDGWNSITAWFSLPDGTMEEVRDSLALDSWCHINSAEWELLGGSTEPLEIGDVVRIQCQLDPDAFGAETGAQMWMNWPGVVDSLLLEDLGEGLYGIDVALEVLPTLSEDLIQVFGQDRADTQLAARAFTAPQTRAFVDVVAVPQGAFAMGETDIATPVHSVTLTQGFFLGRSEVTNAQYKSVLQWAYMQGLVSVSSDNVMAHGQILLNMNPSSCCIVFTDGVFYLEDVADGNYSGQSSAQHPVTNVSWFGAACYCDWISLQSGLTPFYNGDWDSSASHNPYDAEGWRLPTEAEWEYAAQFTDERSYPWGNAAPDASLANYYSIVGCTSPVGSFSSGNSSLGLQDMGGNVWEWSNDWYGSYSSLSSIDPWGFDVSSARVLRGGGWRDNAMFLRCARRGGYQPTVTSDFLGFRLCKVQ
jgi:formylglycine-generating enzyme required for sulfatase activity